MSLPPANAPILARPPTPHDARMPYGSAPEQFGDLRLPRGDGPFPVVVLVHGGYWRAQWTLDLGSHQGTAFANAGFATWNLEYRRVGHAGGGFPGTLADLGDGLDYLRVVAEQYPLDLRRGVAVGHSAGGVMALWLAARRRLPAGHPLRGADPLPLRGVVSLAGVNDLRLRPTEGIYAQMVADFLGGTPDAVPDHYHAASPMDWLPLGVPQVLVHGTADSRVPFEASTRYLQAARAAGDRVELVTLEGLDHFEPIDPESTAWPPVLAAVRRLVA